MTTSEHADADQMLQTLPLTERILQRFGRPKWLWILVWAMVPLASPFVFSAAIDLSGPGLRPSDFANLAATQVVLAYTCLVFLWGAGTLGGQSAALRPDLVRLVPHGAPTALFRAIGSVRGPLLLTILVGLLVSANGWLRYGPLPPLASLPLLIIYVMPLMTFVWVYLVILIDLTRLGRQPLALDQFPQDRTLGLERLGSLASTGLGLVLVAAVPVLVAGSDDPVTLAISLAIVGLTVVTFLLSMWGLHRQMAAAKARFLAGTRQLYADAYAPLRAEASLATLEAQASALRVAQALDERADSLLTWPIDEGTLRFIVVVVTGIVTGLIVRALFAALGF